MREWKFENLATKFEVFTEEIRKIFHNRGTFRSPAYLNITCYSPPINNKNLLRKQRFLVICKANTPVTNLHTSQL